MKRIIYLLTVLPLFFLASCNNDEFGVPDKPATSGGDIEFNIGFAPQMQTRVATDAQFKSTFEDGDAIGIFAVKRASGDTKALATTGNYMHNVKLTYNKTDDKWTGEAYYTNDGDVLDFYAYYPYDAGMSNPNAYTFDVPIDQVSNNGEYYKKNDFLWVKLENVSKSDDAVVLLFSHALAMIEIAISDNVPRQSTVNLLEAVTDCTINLANQSIIPRSTKNTILMWQRHTVSDIFFCWALVPPQTMDIRFLWTKNNIPYTVTPATNVTLTSGNIKKYSTTQP